MLAGGIELCQCTLNLLTFSNSRFPALRGELSGEEIDNSAWLRDSVQDRTPVGNWKPPLCCCFFHSKVNNGWCHWSQGNWLLKLGLKTAKSVLPGTSWLQDRLRWVCSQMSVGWKWGCAWGGCSAPQISLLFWEGLLVDAEVLFPCGPPALGQAGSWTFGASRALWPLQAVTRLQLQFSISWLLGVPLCWCYPD